MLAMQYEITLPADYDMGIIRHRVATRGAGMDAFPGLGLKAYAIRERGVGGSPVNQYCPFYLWADPAGMNEFLFGPGFATLSRDFGRPAVRAMNGIAFAAGPDHHAPVRTAIRTVMRLDPAIGLEEVAAAAVQEGQDQAGTPGLHSWAALVDLAAWDLVRFQLWTEVVPVMPVPNGDRYEILHVSSPLVDQLPQGRTW